MLLFTATPTPVAVPPALGDVITPKERGKVIRELFEVEGCLLAAETCELGVAGSTLFFTGYVCMAAFAVGLVCRLGVGTSGQASAIVGLLLGLVIGSGLFSGEWRRTQEETERHRGEAQKIVARLLARYPELFAGCGEELAKDVELVRSTRAMLARGTDCL
jgi:hypothetical protein